MSSYAGTYAIDLRLPAAPAAATESATGPSTTAWTAMTLRVASFLGSSRDWLSGMDRRLRRVEADPSCAAAADLELLVRAHGVPERQVWQVVDRMSDSEVDATLAWMWTVAFDGTAFAELCAADLSDVELSRRLESDLQHA